MPPDPMLNKSSFFQKIKNKPHNWFLFAGILLLLFPLMPWQINNFADLHVGDTYVVIDLGYFYWFMAIALFLMWALYIAVKKYLYSTHLTQIHVFSSVIVILISALMLAYNPINLRPRRYITYGDRNIINSLSVQDLMTITPIIMLLLVQPVLVVNLAVGLFKSKKNHLKSSQS